MLRIAGRTMRPRCRCGHPSRRRFAAAQDEGGGCGALAPHHFTIMIDQTLAVVVDDVGNEPAVLLVQQDMDQHLVRFAAIAHGDCDRRRPAVLTGSQVDLADRTRRSPEQLLSSMKSSRHSGNRVDCPRSAPATKRFINSPTDRGRIMAAAAFSRSLGHNRTRAAAAPLFDHLTGSGGLLGQPCFAKTLDHQLRV
jgi:hypothetical protein